MKIMSSPAYKIMEVELLLQIQKKYQERKNMLNTKQQEAVNFKNGQMLVVSCPGSGKTTVIVARVHQLIESGVNPSNILIITLDRKSVV